LRLLPSNGYNQSSDLLHIFISLDWVGGEPAGFCWIVRRDISGHALRYVAVSGGTPFSRSSS